MPPDRSGIPSDLVDHLYRGPIEDILPRIPERSIDCVFADPDYNVGVRYQNRSYTRNYESYIEWCQAWASEARRVLKPDGNFFIVNYPKNNAYLRVHYLDTAFAGVYDYVWVYHTNIGQSRNRFTTAHRSILHCVKTKANRFYKENVAEPYLNPTDRRVRKLILAGSPGRMPYSWQLEESRDGLGQSWIEQNLVKNVSRSKSFHSCQIPERLTATLFRATTKPGDVVLILFGGAGSEIAVCQTLGLHWISAEVIPEYCDLIEKRLRNGGRVPEALRLVSRTRHRSRIQSLPA